MAWARGGLGSNHAYLTTPELLVPIPYPYLAYRTRVLQPIVASLVLGITKRGTSIGYIGAKTLAANLVQQMARHRVAELRGTLPTHHALHDLSYSRGDSVDEGRSFEVRHVRRGHFRGRSCGHSEPVIICNLRIRPP